MIKMTPIVRVCILILSVSVPFLIVMITIYAVALRRTEEKTAYNLSTDSPFVPTERPTYCEKTLLISATRKFYEDDPPEFGDFNCSGMVISKNVILTVNCAFEGDRRRYIFGSGSKSWYVKRNLHFFDKEIFNHEIHSEDESIVLRCIRVEPNFPTCVYNGEKIKVVGEDPAYNSENTLVGWKFHQRTPRTPYETIKLTKINLKNCEILYSINYMGHKAEEQRFRQILGLTSCDRNNTTVLGIRLSSVLKDLNKNCDGNLELE